MGWDRKTIRKYVLQSNAMPEYGPRRKTASKSDPFKPWAGASRLVNLVGETADVPENEPPALSDRYYRRREKLRW